MLRNGGFPAKTDDLRLRTTTGAANVVCFFWLGGGTGGARPEMCVLCKFYATLHVRNRVINTVSTHAHTFCIHARA